MPARALMATIVEMGAFSQPAEFTSTPAVIGDAAREAQEPLLLAGRAVVSQSCLLIGTAKALVANAKDARQWQELATNSKAVSDSIKSLVGSIWLLLNLLVPFVPAADVRSVHCAIALPASSSVTMLCWC